MLTVTSVLKTDKWTTKSDTNLYRELPFAPFHPKGQFWLFFLYNIIGIIFSFSTEPDIPADIRNISPWKRHCEGKLHELVAPCLHLSKSHRIQWLSKLVFFAVSCGQKRLPMFMRIESNVSILIVWSICTSRIMSLFFVLGYTNFC